MGWVVRWWLTVLVILVLGGLVVMYSPRETPALLAVQPRSELLPAPSERDSSSVRLSYCSVVALQSLSECRATHYRRM